MIVILNDTNEFACVGYKNKQLEIVFQLRDRVEALESEIKISEKQLEKINAGVFASLHQMIKRELREEFKAVLSAHIKTEETENEGLSTGLSEARPSGAPVRSTLPTSTPYRQLDKEKQSAEGNVASATSFRGPALTILSNLPSESWIHYPSLVAAPESRFGNKRQIELHRIKLHNRVRRQDETPEFAEDIERFARLALPEAFT